MLEIIKLPHEILRHLPQNILTGMLLSGDRISCCSHAAIATIDGKFAGICTIAPDGEQCSGIPTIVALYVISEYRGRLLGRELLILSIKFMAKNNFLPIRIDVMSTNMRNIIEGLPEDLKNNLQLSDHKDILDIFQD
jgi:GNAT superfamily N-acetyltransferase